MNLAELNERSRTIFRQIVETYLETGQPVGSRTVSRLGDTSLSPASIRNVMADLEDVGLLDSPHTSAGRVPTHLGLRLFVDGLLETGDLTSEERADIESKCAAEGTRLEDVLERATTMLSGLSHCAGVVMAPTINAPLKHVEFVKLEEARALVVAVTEDGAVENRLIDLPTGLPPSALMQAANYLNARLAGRTFDQATELIAGELRSRQAELDQLTQKVVEAGVAELAGQDAGRETLIVRGRANLIDDLAAIEDLERIRMLFDDLEQKRDLVKLLDLARAGEGVKIFIGAENSLFSLSGSSVIASPYVNGANQLVGVIGVIGPTRINYARIIPMVDYTAKVIGQLL
ncbi:MAG: heat-inducible transcriptional repressor HrcA [Sphingomonadales bacterium]|nr:heat-inducible transcriptional repressor HrcA [Sphingomonadales bacterium]